MNLNIDTNVIIAVAGAITSVAAAIAVVKKTVKKQFDKVKDNFKKEIKEEIKNEIVEPMYNKAVEQYQKDFSDIKEQIEQLILEQRKLNASSFDFRISTLKGLLVQAHNTYTEKGEIESMVLATLEDVYKTYQDLGGNHFVGNLMEEIRALPKK